MSTTTLSR